MADSNSYIQVEAPKKKSFSDKAWDALKGLTVGFACVGIMAWSVNQITDLIVKEVTKTPTLRHTSDGDVGCVIYLGNLSCFERVLSEEMPEPEAEISFDEAVQMLRQSIKVPNA